MSVFLITVLVVVEWYSIRTLTFVSLITNDVEHHYWPLIYLLWTMSTQILSLLLKLSHSFIIELWVLYIFWIHALYWIYDLQILSHIVLAVLPLSRWCQLKHSSFSYYEVNFIYFFLWSLVLIVSCLKKIIA